MKTIFGIEGTQQISVNNSSSYKKVLKVKVYVKCKFVPVLN
jgi:hypothetical protein